MVCTGPLKAARWECAQPHTFSHTVHHHTHALTLSTPSSPGGTLTLVQAVPPFTFPHQEMNRGARHSALLAARV